MQGKELYIDGLRVDVGDRLDITLRYEGNVFTDVDKISSNHSYTVSLPNTINNRRAIGMATIPAAVQDFTAKKHTVDYIADGVPIIQDGQGIVTECNEDGISLVIYWGVATALKDVEDRDVRLNQLGSDIHLPFNKANEPDKYEDFTARGYGYADYTEEQVKETTEEWQGYYANQSTREETVCPLTDGAKIRTGKSVGEVADVSNTTDAEWKTLLTDFRKGATAVISGVGGTGEYRSWAILNEAAEVLQIAADTAETTNGADLTKDNDNVLGGTNQYIMDDWSKGAAVGTVRISVEEEAAVRTVELGYMECDEQMLSCTPTMMQTVQIPKGWSGTYTIDAGWRKPEGSYLYVRISTQSLRMYYVTGGSTSGVVGVDGTGYWTNTVQAMISADYEGGEPKATDYRIDAPATARYLIVNTMKSIGEGASVTILQPIEEQRTWENAQWKAIQPSVTCHWINERIAATQGLRLQMPTEIAEQMRTLAVPLITQDMDEMSIKGNILNVTAEDRTTYGEMKMEGTLPPFLSFVDGRIYYTPTGTATAAKIRLKIQADVTISTANFTWIPVADDKYNYTGREYLEMMVRDGSGNETSYIVGGTSVNDFNDKPIRFSYTKNDEYATRLYGEGVIDLEVGSTIYLYLRTSKEEHEGLRCENVTIEGEVVNDGEMPFGSYFPIGINLPNIKVTDYIKFLNLITGTFPRLAEGSSDTVQMVRVSDVYQNIGKSVDWSDRICSGKEKPEATEYKYGEWAQHNRLKWKQDDTVIENHDADITLANEALEYERDVWELPFAASDGNRVPIRTAATEKWTSDKGFLDLTRSGYEYKGCEPRIMGVRNAEGKASLIFNIDLENIFKDKWGDVLKCLAKPVVITEKMRLRWQDLLSFDESVPVYIRQYSCYFAVVEMEITEGVATVKMIKLN